MTIAAVILAAGESRRLGRPKQLLEYGGETLLRRAVKAADGAGCYPALVVLGAGAETIGPPLSGTPARILLNDGWEEGMSSSIRLAIKSISSDSNLEAALLMVCDQPLVDSCAIGLLIERQFERPESLVVAEYLSRGETVRGVPAIFPRRLFLDLLELRGAAGAREIISRNRTKVEAVPMPGAALDIDTEREIRNLRAFVPL